MSDQIKSIKIAQEFVIEASTEKVFRSLTDDVSAWWDHAFEKDSRIGQSRSKSSRD